ncbi:MAG: cytochrome c3 family protein [Gemmatimonadota bacterium]
MNNLCLDCHREIRWLIDRSRGFHASDPAANCTSCHPDHAGEDFQMIKWPEGSAAQFDHRRSGWTLEESHATAKCRDCHTARLRNGEAAQLSPRRGQDPGWVGLERSCIACHEDVHRSSLNQQCNVCHDARDWGFATRFDHARSRYPLTGAHVNVDCSSCHKPPVQGAARNDKGEPIPVFRPVRFNQCSDCHRDPHAGRLGGTCDDCHVTRGFRVIGRDQFNHERTRYPLRGKHAAVACAGCHDANSAQQWSPSFTTCGSCHRDAHAGQAVIAGKAADCAQCHSVNGFAPGVFSMVQHRGTRYPLEGRHAVIECTKCHVRRSGPAADSLGSARVVLRPAFTNCRSCHADDHGSQLVARADHGACESCHTVQGWQPTTFTPAQHGRLRVTLQGRHGNITCQACHGPERKGLPPLPNPQTLGRARIAITLSEVECAACHLDPHDGRFAAGGARPLPGGCVACHSDRSFRPSTVDVAAHEKYPFRLDGAHQAVPCASCHDESRRQPVTTSLVRAGGIVPRLPFTVASTACASCHRTPHGDQFAGRPGDCTSCHDVVAFRPTSRFNHDRDSQFRLEGAHGRVACEKCHVSRRDATGSALVVQYRGIPTKCEACHLGGAR